MQNTDEEIDFLTGNKESFKKESVLSRIYILVSNL